MNTVVLLTSDDPDGLLMDAAAMHFSALAQGIMRGDGIFESALYAGGRVRKLDRHLARLARSARMTGIEIPSEESWRRAVDTAIDAWRPEPSEEHVADEAVVKLMVIRGYGPENAEGYAWVTVTPLAKALRPSEPIKVALLDRGFSSTTSAEAPWLLLGAKTLSYATNMAAGREARARGAQDVIFRTSDGFILEGPTSTVVLKRGESLVTPGNEIGILPGTTQRALFDAAEQHGWSTSYERLTARDLHEADAVWLTSSGRLLSQVGALDDVELNLDDDAHHTLVKWLLATI